MTDLTLFSNKKRKETPRYIFILAFAIISWILQVSVVSRFLVLDTFPNILLLSTIYLGLTFGVEFGVLSGIIFAFLNTSIVYDHMFYFPLPLIGLISGLLAKNLFSDELLFFIVLSFLLTLPFEYLTGFQRNLNSSINITDRFLMISTYSALLNLLIAPFFYLFMNLIAKNLKIR